MTIETSTEMVRAEVTDIVPEPQEMGMTMVVSPAVAKQRLLQLQTFVRSVMRRGEHYGRIPGTQKDCLFKAGAEQLSEIYALAPDYILEVATEDWETNFFYYRIKCILKRGERFVCAGLGSCNSREDRYAWRWVGEKYLPAGIDKKLLRSKRGKFGMTFRVPNDDIASQVNTVLKMAKKRAFVDGVITATRSSGIFTQDLEDLPIPEDVPEDDPPPQDLENALRESTGTQEKSPLFERLMSGLVDARSADALDQAAAAIAPAKTEVSKEQLASLRKVYGECKKTLGLS